MGLGSSSELEVDQEGQARNVEFATAPQDEAEQHVVRRNSREVNLDEGEARGRAFAEYVKELAPGEKFNLEKGRENSCGLGCGQDPSMAIEFARVIQHMIRSILSTPSSERLRMFDNSVTHFEVADGLYAKFEETRSTQFRRLRTAAGITEQVYLASMCDEPFLGGEKEASGKSGSLFLRTHDKQFVLKTVEQHEFLALYEILPNYVLYLEENTNSLLCRFLGAYSLTVHGITLRFVVMANVLPCKALKVYDLKGTTEDRWVDPVRSDAVLKDNNFANSTMVLEAAERKRLIQTIRDDSEFLESLGLMDYSLLVGVSEPEILRSGSWLGGSTNTSRIVQGALRVGQAEEEEPAPYVFQLGIIDYLQRWTPKKVAAHWLKKPTLGCCHEIDTEPPQIYAARFFKYFTVKIVVKGSDTSAINGH